MTTETRHPLVKKLEDGIIAAMESSPDEDADESLRMQRDLSDHFLDEVVAEIDAALSAPAAAINDEELGRLIDEWSRELWRRRFSPPVMYPFETPQFARFVREALLPPGSVVIDRETAKTLLNAIDHAIRWTPVDQPFPSWVNAKAALTEALEEGGA